MPKFSELTELTAPASADELAIVDKSDTSAAASGKTKRIQLANLVADGSITTAKLANDAVTSDKIANSAVLLNNIADNAVTTAKIAGTAVTTAKLANDAVTASKIADDAVQLNHILDNAVRTNHIAPGNVTEEKLANEAVTASKLALGSVQTDHVVNGNITTAKLADDAVTSVKVADSTVTLAKLAADAQAIAALNSANGGTLTIASGLITVGTAGRYAVDTESAAAFDYLTSISGGTEGQVISLSPFFPTRAIIVEHLTAAIQLERYRDCVLADVNDSLVLQKRGTRWVEIGRSLHDIARSVVASPDTLLLSDASLHRGLTVNSDSPTSISIPANATVPIPADSVIPVTNRYGEGTVTITAVAGVEINGVDGGSVRLPRNKSCVLWQLFTDQWIVSGGISDANGERIQGTDLTNGAETLEVGDGSIRTLRDGALSGATSRAKTLGTTGASNGDIITVNLLDDNAAETVTVVNGGAGAGTLVTHSTIKARYEFRFDGTDWVLSGRASVA